MNVTVRFEAQLREAAGVDHVQTELRSGASLIDALQQAAEVASQPSSDGSLRHRILTDEARPSSSLLIFVNDQPVAHHAITSHVLHDGDCVLLFPPISGG